MFTLQILNLGDYCKVTVVLEQIEASEPVALRIATRWRQRHVSAHPPAGLGIRLQRESALVLLPGSLSHPVALEFPPRGRSTFTGALAPLCPQEMPRPLKYPWEPND